MYRVQATWDRGYAVPKYVAKCPHPTGTGTRCGHDNAVDEKTERLTCRCNSEIEVSHDLPVDSKHESSAVIDGPLWETEESPPVSILRDGKIVSSKPLKA